MKIAIYTATRAAYARVPMDARRIVDYSALRMVVTAGSKCLVCVSGGADSTCLLHAMHELSVRLGSQLEVIHVNHLVRGSDAKADFEFVRAECLRIGVICHYREIEPLRRKPRGKTTEEFFREQRHRLFYEVAAERGISCIALGHTADDLAETFLMHLLRGAGLRGMSFSFSQRQGDFLFIRPLWQTPRSEIEAFLASRQIAFREDLSNQSTEFTRNRVRHSLIPQIEREFNPSAREALRRSARVLTLAGDYITELALKWLSRMTRRSGDAARLPLHIFRALPEVLQMEVAREWVRQGGDGGATLAYEHTEAIVRLAHSSTAKGVHLRGGLRIVRTADMLQLIQDRLVQERGEASGDLCESDDVEELAKFYLKENPGTLLALIEKPIGIGDLQAHNVVEVPLTLLDGMQLTVIISGSYQGDLLAEGFSSEAPFEPPFVLRNRCTGDRLSKSVKLKSVLINDKVPYYIRDYLVVLADARGRVFEILGMERIGARVRRASGLTLNIELAQGL